MSLRSVDKVGKFFQTYKTWHTLYRTVYTCAQSKTVKVHRIKHQNWVHSTRHRSTLPRCQFRVSSSDASVLRQKTSGFSSKIHRYYTHRPIHSATKLSASNMSNSESKTSTKIVDGISVCFYPFPPKAALLFRLHFDSSFVVSHHPTTHVPPPPSPMPSSSPLVSRSRGCSTS
jgi:hypothetical protein